MLVRLLARLEERSGLVTLAQLERAAAGRRTRSLPPEAVASLLDAAVSDMLILTDRRLFLDRASGALVPTSVYRVNRRHQEAREALT